MGFGNKYYINFYLLYLVDICLGIVIDFVESFKNRKLRWMLMYECYDIVLF